MVPVHEAERGLTLSLFHDGVIDDGDGKGYDKGDDHPDDNMSISFEQLLDFLDTDPPHDSLPISTSLPNPSVGFSTTSEYVYTDEDSKHPSDNLECAVLRHLGEHGSMQTMAPRYADASAGIGCTFDAPQNGSDLEHELWHAADESSPLRATVFVYQQPNEISDCEPFRDVIQLDYDDEHESDFISDKSSSQREFEPPMGKTLDMPESKETVSGSTFTLMRKQHSFSPQNDMSRVKADSPQAFRSDLCTSLSTEPFFSADGTLSNIHDAVVDSNNTYDIICGASNQCMTNTYPTDKTHSGPFVATDFFPHLFSLPLQSSDLGSVSDPNAKNSRPGISQVMYANGQTNFIAPYEEFGISSYGIPLTGMQVLSPDSKAYQCINVECNFIDNCASSKHEKCVIDSIRYSNSEQAVKCEKPNDSLKDQSNYVFHPSHQIHFCHSNEVANVTTPQSSTVVDEDADVCILDDISSDSNWHLQSLPKKIPSLQSGFSESHYFEDVPSWPKTHDERLTFQIALQDLSQPAVEVDPPDGVLAVPLLRHQRMALSWMIQKETTSPQCSGGILADDQGLGKTISTIALILTERSPSKYCNEMARQVEVETLSLDDDDDVPQLNISSQPGNSHLIKVKKPLKSNTAFASVKGRPPAGTLVVCPTSVLRQWADELHNKVTSKGNLSVLLYHGSNRTKDPNELSKYDIVLTTYSIVSMEVPKYLISDRSDDEKGKLDNHGLAGSSANRKRKAPSSAKAKNSKDGIKADSTFLESAARPLARVSWFRVILDEAQTIKNHRTQVARACCGLRAKRRWCLSGTPIQNAIDDLYSYFRFLKYEPYAAYKSFCSTIKIPISRNPTNGYRKLQAVLKTIMLRRTKGSLIEGQPIINLPSKSIFLKKVEFSLEERSFYSRLEAESREQFKVYADAGTVKQNYVNILLMLLRLRQACDHPLLVQGCDSHAVWKSSIESAKNLPKDKQRDLLSRLEVRLSLCSACNDPPEDAVIAICGHVFCNQCICEHLTTDDNLCPSSHCKVKLNTASVFPKIALERAICSSPEDDDSHAGYCDKLIDTTETHAENLPSESSKIKAALEILKSLPILEDCSATINSEKHDVINCREDVNGAVPLTREIKNTFEDCCDGHLTEKAIVFSQWTRMLDLLEAQLKCSCIQYRRLDGTMSIAARDKAVKDFNMLPKVTVMIMSLKAASLGLNMVAACHVLLLDLWWNPTTEDQAIDRAHRIGQTRPVTVSRLTVKDTVEDRILALQEKKREMVAFAFGEDKTGSRETRLTVDDLKYLFMA